jgi:hypothetical protein
MKMDKLSAVFLGFSVFIVACAELNNKISGRCEVFFPGDHSICVNMETVGYFYGLSDSQMHAEAERSCTKMRSTAGGPTDGSIVRQEGGRRVTRFPGYLAGSSCSREGTVGFCLSGGETGPQTHSILIHYYDGHSNPRGHCIAVRGGFTVAYPN